MTVHLRTNVFAAQVEEDLVLLDLARDRYLCVPGASSSELRLSSDRRTLDGLQPEQRAALMQAGLVSEVRTLGACPPDLPTRGLDPSQTVEPSPADRIRLAQSVLDLVLGYAGRPFADLLAASLAPAEAPAGAVRDVEREARLFHRLAVWAPVGPKCLARSFLLRRFLRRAGCDAAWVFGVRTWPFGAHCWLQAGDVVLDDAPERVAQFEPILAA